jgi:GNAT superfamily N-acetyltransferase
VTLPDVVVGPAGGPADEDALFGMYRQLVDEEVARPEDGQTPRSVFEEGWLRRRRLYVARRGADVVGGCFVRTNFPAFAPHIAQGGYLVDRRHRRQGIGRLLVEFSMTEARRTGYTAMMFNLVRADSPSTRLYEELGFVVVGRVPSAFGRLDGLVYWTDLSGGDGSP